MPTEPTDYNARATMPTDYSARDLSNAGPNGPGPVRTGVFWFQAQTGRISRAHPDAPSNFAWYRLPIRALSRVIEAADAATPGPGGLEYAPEFLIFLDCFPIETRLSAGGAL